MKDLTKYYIDLSKCTEEQQKHLEKLTKIEFIMMGQYPYLSWDYDCFTTFKGEGLRDKTELTYPEFIKLFEDGDGERKVDIYSGELNTERILTYKKLSEQYNIEESTVRDIFNAGADWVINLNSNN